MTDMLLLLIVIGVLMVAVITRESAHGRRPARVRGWGG
jgi:hypothetical protein